MQRVAEAYADIFAELEPAVRSRLVQTIGAGRRGALPPAEDVQDLADRLSGRITFSEYLERGRRRRR
ncbi:MAG: hypothetical protein WAR57_12260 [Candidatus Phosphoribacter sp.]